MKILFLCRGNVGRSAFGEYVYNKITHTKDAYSAGTQLSGPEESLNDLLPKSQFIIDCMQGEGIEIGEHVRRSVTEEMTHEADIIIDMAEQDTVPDFVKRHPKRIVWTVDDPKGTSLEEHIRIKNEIKEKIESFLESNEF